MSRTNRTRYTILGCLTVDPMSGYDIKRFVDEVISHFWSESYGQIYPTLHELKDEELIAGRREPGERGPDRVVYRITDAGREELAKWLREPAEPQTARYEHSLKVFFGHVVGPAETLRHVERLRERTAATLVEYSEAERELEASEAPWAPYWLVVLRGGIRYSEMVLEWCAAAEAELKELQEA